MRTRVGSREMVSPPLRAECPPACMLSVFVPAHIWPSLEHLFNRCCSWQALHDIKSEILTENQTAPRPLAAHIHRLVFAVQICMFPFLFFFRDLQLTLTWNKWLYRNPLRTCCLLFFCPWPWGHGRLARAALALEPVITVPAALATHPAEMLRALEPDFF